MDSDTRAMMGALGLIVCGVFLLLGLILGVAMFFDSVGCRSVGEKTGRPTEWHITTGCLVHTKKAGIVPLNAYRAWDQ